MSSEIMVIKAMEKCTAQMDAIYHIITQIAFFFNAIIFRDNKKG